MRTRLVAAFAVALATCGGKGVDALSLRVPEDYPTLLSASDAAAPADSIVVGPGKWTETDTRTVNVNGIPRLVTGCAFVRGGVSIVGSGIDVTTVDPSGTDNGLGILVTVSVLETLGEGVVTLEGMTFTGARRSTGGAGALAVINADGVVARDCRFAENGATDLSIAGLGAVLSARNAAVQLLGCLVDRNISAGGALFVNELDLTIADCRFEENEGRVVNYDESLEPGHQVRILDSEFVGNRSESGNGCVALAQSNDFVIRGCRFVRNVAVTAVGAAILIADSRGVIEFCEFDRDSCLAVNGSAAAIAWQNSYGTVRNCTFVGCHSLLDGAAFVGGFGGEVEFRQNLLTHTTGAAPVRVLDTHLEDGTGCNVFWGNTAGDYGNWPVMTGDVVADPMYCGLELGDYTVREDSPCVVGPCAPVGAYDVGCSPVSVEPTTWARVKTLYRSEGGQ